MLSTALAKRDRGYKSTVSAKVCNLFKEPAFHFFILEVSLQVSYRLRGAGYRTYSSNVPPKGKNRRWLRHWLLAHSPTGIRPFPLVMWFTLPEGGSLDPTGKGSKLYYGKDKA